LLSKTKNIYFGQAIGDALGLATEFMSKAEIAQNYPNGIHNYDDIIRDEHRSRFEFGAWTDDTDQFLCIDKSIKKYGFVNSLDIAKEFKNWFNDKPMGIGKTTYEILKLPEYTYKPEQCAEFIWRIKGSDLAPNGALMRNAAVVIHSYENEKKVLENCKKVCHLTHFDQRCVDSCQIHGLLLSRVINGGDTSLKSILESISTLDSRTKEYIKNNLTKDIASLNLEDSKTWGYTLKSLCAGLWGFYYSESFESGLLTIINEGGDADTNGCIAGTLMAAKFGDIPHRWIAGLNQQIT
jgi:ADP-ribosylglycohydrolase